MQTRSSRNPPGTTAEEPLTKVLNLNLSSGMKTDE